MTGKYPTKTNKKNTCTLTEARRRGITEVGELIHSKPHPFKRLMLCHASKSHGQWEQTTESIDMTHLTKRH